MSGTSIFTAMLLTVGGGVVYHVAAKSVPRDAAPTLVLIVAYATALSISGLAHVSLPDEPGHAPSWRLLHPGIFGLGLGAAMIELGYILTYRAARPVIGTSALVNSLVAVILIPVGLIAFRENVSINKTAGIVLCLAGVWLLRR